MAKQGQIHFSITGNNSDFLAKIRQNNQAVKDGANITDKASAQMRSAIMGVGAAVGVGFGIDQLRQFGMEMINVRGQFQTFEAVLTNTFGDKNKAKESMEMIQNFAATTPFQVDALTGSFVKLVNQGFTPTYKEMTLLGDLASSTGKGFDQLTEAIIDAQTGEFERLKEFGIRASKEGDKVTFNFKEQATQVDFTASSIRDYILSLGELQGVQGSNAAIAATLTGQVSNLEDSITQMMNNIGQSSEGVLSGAISSASYLVEHYEEVGKILTSLIATYGTYKAALLSVVVIEKARMFADNIRLVSMFRKELGLLTAAQQAFNITAKANPYVLLATTLVAVGTAIWAFSDSTDKAAAAQEKLNKKISEFDDKSSERRSKIDSLISTIQDEASTTLQQVAAYEQLMLLSPALTRAYSLQEITTLGLKDAQKLLNEENEKAKYDMLVKEVENAESALGKLEEQQENLRKSGDSVTNFSGQYESLKKELETAKTTLSEYEKLCKKAEEEAKPIEVKIIEAKADVDQLQSEFEIAKKALEDEKKKIEQQGWGFVDIAVQFRYKNAKNNLGQAQSTLSGLEQEKEDQNKNKPLTAEQKKALEEQAKKAKDLEDLRIKYKEEANAKELELQKSLINDKEKLLEFDLEQTLNAIAKEEQAYKTRGGKDTSSFDSMRDTAIKEYYRDLFTHYDEEIKADEEKNAEKEKKRKEEEAKNKEFLTNLNEEYATYQQKRDKLTQEYETKRAAMFTDESETKFTEGFNQGNLDNLTKEFKDNLKELDFDNLLNTDDFLTLFNNLESQSVSAMLQLKERIENAWEGLDLSPEQLEAIRDRLDKLDDVVRTKNPFAALADGIKSYKKAEDETAKSTAFQKSMGAVADIANFSKEALDGTVGLLDEMGVELDGATEELVGEIGGMLNSAGGIATSLMSGDIFGAITNGISFATSLIGTFDFAADKRNQKLAEEREHLENLSNVYDDLISKQSDLIDQGGEIGKQAYNDALELLEAQQQTEEAWLKNWFSSGASWKSHSEGYKYNRDFGSTLSQDQMFAMTGDQWEDFYLNNAEFWAKLPKEVQDYGTYMMQSGEQLDDFNDQMRESIAGITFDDVKNELDSFLSDWGSTWETATDDFDKFMMDIANRKISEALANDITELENMITDAWESGDVSPEELEAINRKRKEIYEKAESEREKYADSLGVDLGGTEDRTATAKGIATASQDSVDENNAIGRTQLGFMSGIHDGVHNFIIPDLAKVRESFALMQVNLVDQLVELRGIRKNTDSLPQMGKDISTVKTDISAMNKGMKKLVTAAENL